VVKVVKTRCTAHPEEVRGWNLQDIVRHKCVTDTLKASASQARTWVLLSCVLTMVFVAFALIRVGFYGLAVVPVAVIVLLALLSANTAPRPKTQTGEGS